MMIAANVSFPYRTLPGEIFGTDPWHILNAANEWEPMSEELPGWDYNMDLSLGRRVNIDADKVRHHCGLPQQANIGIVCFWTCRTSHLRKMGYGPEPLGNTSEEIQIRFIIPGNLVAQSVDFHLELVLIEPLDISDRFVAKSKGDRLAARIDTLVLEGIGSRFPVQEIDFTTAGWIGSNNACWHIEWNPNQLDLPVRQEVRLYLNSGNEQFLQEVRNPESQTASFVYLDVARRLVSGALANEAFRDDFEDFPEGSIGATVAGLLTVCFPGLDIISIQQLYINDRSRFETKLQGAMGGVNV